MAVKVPQPVYDGLEAVRESGITNMADSHAVQKVASDMDYYHTVIWIQDNRDQYRDGFFDGFEPEEGINDGS